jgi:hypothetical protein
MLKAIMLAAVNAPFPSLDLVKNQWNNHPRGCCSPLTIIDATPPERIQPTTSHFINTASTNKPLGAKHFDAKHERIQRQWSD